MNQGLEKYEKEKRFSPFVDIQTKLKYQKDINMTHISAHVVVHGVGEHGQTDGIALIGNLQIGINI